MLLILMIIIISDMMIISFLLIMLTAIDFFSLQKSRKIVNRLWNHLCIKSIDEPKSQWTWIIHLLKIIKLCMQIPSPAAWG